MMPLLAQIGCALFGLLVLLACFSDRIPRIKKWADTIPDGSGKTLADAARPEAHGCYVEPDHVRIKREAYAKRHAPLTPWEVAHAQEAWEGHKAAEEIKRRAE